MGQAAEGLEVKIVDMKQIALCNGLELSRKRIFFEEMERLIPKVELIAQIVPHVPLDKRLRVPYPPRSAFAYPIPAIIFRTSGPAKEEAIDDVPLYRQFAGLNLHS